jgi:hypothetical protein
MPTKYNPQTLFVNEHWALAKYSYPYSTPTCSEDASNFDSAKLLKQISKNKVLLATYENLCKANCEHENLVKLKELINQYLREKSYFILDFPATLKREVDEPFKENKISYMLPKYSIFTREQNDMDVLVSPKNFGAAQKLLLSRGYRVASVQEQGWKITFTKWVDNRRCDVHLHGKLIWSLEFIPTELLRAKAVQIKVNPELTVSAPCAEHAVLVVAMHALYENRSVALSDVFQLEGILRRTPNVDWHSVVDLAKHFGWCIDLYTFFLIINYISKSLYNKQLVAESTLLYAKKQIPAVDKIVRNACLVGQENCFRNLPFEYPPRIQHAYSFARVAVTEFGIYSVPKIVGWAKSFAMLS